VIERRAARVLVCDDVEELRALVASTLAQAPELEIVGEAGDADLTVRLASDTHPDVVLLDLSLPGLAPERLILAVAAAVPAARLVAYSGRDPRDVLGAAESLLASYVPKSTPLPQLRAHLVAICEEMVHEAATQRVNDR
jgi:DNA-binding NarL/FixJ family response regulator